MEEKKDCYTKEYYTIQRRRMINGDIKVYRVKSTYKVKHPERKKVAITDEMREAVWAKEKLGVPRTRIAKDLGISYYYVEKALGIRNPVYAPIPGGTEPATQ